MVRHSEDGFSHDKAGISSTYSQTISDSSRKHHRTKVTPDFHIEYSKNGGNLGSESK